MPQTKDKAIKALLGLLDLEVLENNLFRGTSPKHGWQRVFGGQVIGQALMAAVRTVEDRPVHSLHGYFVLPGDPKVPIIYQVDRIRDGKSFTTRQVTAIQHGSAIFTMGVSFHRPEPGFDHAVAIPDVPAPEALASESKLKQLVLEQMPATVRAYWERERPIELRPVDLSRYVSPVPVMPATQQIWLRATAPLPDDPALHQCVLAYATDFTLLDTTLIAHGKLMFDPSLQMASLDHSIWFHRPFRADDWLLYAQDSPSAHGARGFARGSVFDRRGVLVASVAQEGLIRQRTTN